MCRNDATESKQPSFTFQIRFHIKVDKDGYNVREVKKSLFELVKDAFVVSKKRKYLHWKT